MSKLSEILLIIFFAFIGFFISVAISSHRKSNKYTNSQSDKEEIVNGLTKPQIDNLPDDQLLLLRYGDLVALVIVASSTEPEICRVMIEQICKDCEGYVVGDVIGVPYANLHLDQQYISSCVLGTKPGTKKYQWTVSGIKEYEVTLYAIGPVGGKGTVTLGPTRLERLSNHFGVEPEKLVGKKFESNYPNATAALFGFIFEIMHID